MDKQRKQYAKIFKALCDEKRLYILELLRDGEKCACVISDLTDIQQSALSYHMKILCESGIVARRQVGKWSHYSLKEGGGEAAAALLRTLTTPNTSQTENDHYLEQLQCSACAMPRAAGDA